jgi:hypothetical protein
MSESRYRGEKQKGSGENRRIGENDDEGEKEELK